MFIPENIDELLDERIQFCESILSNKDKVPASAQTENMIERFDAELKNFKKVKELLTVLRSEQTENIEEVRRQFQLAASEMMSKLIAHCRQQLDSVDDLLSIHQMLNLIDALNKISQQIYHL
jgi:L-lysine 2,3-aminomutase